MYLYVHKAYLLYKLMDTIVKQVYLLHTTQSMYDATVKAIILQSVQPVME